MRAALIQDHGAMQRTPPPPTSSEANAGTMSDAQSKLRMADHNTRESQHCYHEQRAFRQRDGSSGQAHVRILMFQGKAGQAPAAGLSGKLLAHLGSHEIKARQNTICRPATPGAWKKLSTLQGLNVATASLERSSVRCVMITNQSRVFVITLGQQQSSVHLQSAHRISHGSISFSGKFWRETRFVCTTCSALKVTCCDDFLKSRRNEKATVRLSPAQGARDDEQEWYGSAALTLEGSTLHPNRT